MSPKHLLPELCKCKFHHHNHIFKVLKLIGDCEKHIGPVIFYIFFFFVFISNYKAEFQAVIEVLFNAVVCSSLERVEYREESRVTRIVDLSDGCRGSPAAIKSAEGPRPNR